MSDFISFVKFPRDLLPTKKTSPFYGHPNLTHIFLMILEKVRFGETSTQFETAFGKIEINPKEFLLNERQLTWDSGLPRMTVRDSIKKLVKKGIIYKKRPSYPSVIETVIPSRHRVPYVYALTDKYYDMIYNYTPSYPSVIETVIPSRHHKKKEIQKEINQIEFKEYKCAHSEPIISAVELAVIEVSEPKVELVEKTPSETNKVKPRKEIPPPSDVVLSVAEEWLKEAKIRFPWKEFKKSTFAESLVKVQMKTGLNDEGVKKLYETYKQSDFWKGKVLPTTLLNKCRDGLTKCDHLLKKINEGEASMKLLDMALKIDETTDTEEMREIKMRILGRC